MTADRRDRPVDGATLRDFVICERRVWHDAGTPEIMADHVSPSLERFWSGGSARMAELTAVLLAEGAADLRAMPAMDLQAATCSAMVGGAPHVLGAEIAHGDLLARPDVLSRVEGRWHAGSVKAGPLLGADGEPQAAHAVEVALAVHLLGVTGLGSGDRGFLLGHDGERVWLSMAARAGSSKPAIDRQLQDALDGTRAIRGGTLSATGTNRPACVSCRWRSLCRSELAAADDLTLVHGVDRAVRRLLRPLATTVTGLAALGDGELWLADGHTSPATPFAGTLVRLRDRARLLRTAGSGPFARAPLGLRPARRELHVVAATDPARDGLVYAHAVLERGASPPGGHRPTRHAHWIVDGTDDERDAWLRLWRLLASARSARVFLRDEAQKAAYRRLAEAYPDVCDPASLERLLSSSRVVVLREGVIEPRTEWPVQDYAVESLAAFVTHGDPLGGAHGSVRAAWFDALVATGDQGLRERLGDALRDACRASARVSDVLMALPVEGSPGWRERSDAVPVAAGPQPGRKGKGMVRRTLFARQSAVHHQRPLEEPAVPAAAIGPTPPRSHVYATPSLRPCAAIAPEGGMPMHGIEQAWGALTEQLPLLGAGALASAADGDPVLASRLRSRSPWLEPAIAAIERSLRLSMWRGAPWLAFSPVIIVGPAGCGKSDFHRQLSRHSGVPSASLDFASMADALTLAGVARGWTTAMPSWPARVMAETRSANPILFLDEVDKAAGSRTGNGGAPLDALLSMLEPSTSVAYHDRCLLAPVDLSACCWIGAANDVSLLPPVLLSRFEVVEVPAPGDEHFDGLLAGIVADLARSWDLPPGMLADLPARAVSVLRGAFARHRSPRVLARHVRRVLPGLLAGVRAVH